MIRRPATPPRPSTATVAPSSLVFFLLLLGLAWPAPGHAKFCWGYSETTATHPTPWVTACGVGEDPSTHDCFDTTGADLGCTDSDFLHPRGCTDAADPTCGATGGQTIAEEHRNWHCRNEIPRPTSATQLEKEAWGRAFLSFHRQFILDYDVWRLEFLDGTRLGLWDPAPANPIPGDDETDSADFTHCESSPGVRPAASICAGCIPLPDQFKESGGLATNFGNVGELGYALEVDTSQVPPDKWHRSYHVGVSTTGCADLSDVLTTPYDPAFWLAHNKLDEVNAEWLRLNAADVVIVLDRSGSMDDDCTSSSPPLGETDCKINDAREAARTFALAVEDDRGVGEPDHKLGLVSFSGSATALVELTPADTVAGGAFETQLDSITAGGGTSIGAGIEEALDMLTNPARNPTPNVHQAILVLSDGKENVVPCLDGADEGFGGNDCIGAEIGDPGVVQVVAIGIGEGAQEGNLRDLAEAQGGTFFAFEDGDLLDLQKFFVTAHGTIYDGSVVLDPRGVMKQGQKESAPFEVSVCGDAKLSVVLGQKPVGRSGDDALATFPDGEVPPGFQCDLELQLFTPSGVAVDRTDPGVEAGHRERHDFLHVDLPYRGEAAGNWTGKIVRRPGSCRFDQEYFYSVLAQGGAAVRPYPERTQTAPGQSIHASFRIPEPQRPIDGFDKVDGEVTLTRPDGTTEALTLFDDGTHGDRLSRNNIWTADFGPAPAAGAYHLRATMDLTEGACTRHREAEYTVVVEEPGRCARPSIVPTLGAGGYRRSQPGDIVPTEHILCVRNACGTEDRYRVEIADPGWLRRQDPVSGALTPVPAVFQTGPVAPFQRECHLLDDLNLVAVVPADAAPGDRSDVAIRVVSLGHPGEEPAVVATGAQAFPPNDCNANDIPDEDDLASGTSKDEDGNLVPDECGNNMKHPAMVPHDDSYYGGGTGGGHGDIGGPWSGCWTILVVLALLLLGIAWVVRR